MQYKGFVKFRKNRMYFYSPAYDKIDMEALVNGFSEHTFDFYHQVTTDQFFDKLLSEA